MPRPDHPIVGATPGNAGYDAAKAADDALNVAEKLQTSTDQADSRVVKDVDWVSDNIIAKGNAAFEQYTKLESPVEANLEGLEEPAKDLVNAMTDSNDAALKTIADNVSSWAEQSETLMKTLDGVAQIHPFIAVVVLAFKTAVQLELQRRDNDRKVGALRVQRMDMMSVLCDLQHVSDKAAVENDTRLADLIKRTANDIKDCTQVCDKYVQKKLVVKILKSGSWSTKLTAFGTLFTNRKTEFQFALSIYTSKGVEHANEAIGDVQGTVDATQDKIDMLLLFKMLESPTEREVMHHIQAKGGAAKVMGNDRLLKEVMDAFPAAMTTSNTTSTASSNDEFASSLRNRDSEAATLQSLKKELNENIDTLLARERSVFEAKFDVQMKQLTELKTQVTRESDRVISTLLAGPGDRIKDKAMHQMWKEMGWKASTRTTRFVLVLRDYYIDKYVDEPQLNQGPANVTGDEQEDKEYAEVITSVLPSSDKWALSYIEFSHLQAISEAFDDDASGFITVQEVNKFTSSRPLGWSLPHWVAFWAVGWHWSLKQYVTKINTKLIPAIQKVAENVLPANRGKVDRYLSSWKFSRTNAFLNSVNPCQDSDRLLDYFQSYIDEEEKRLDSNLKPLKYEIDAPNTLALVTGPGRFEQFLLPLLYLVLTHHYRLIELSTREIIPDQEFKAALDTLFNIFNGAAERMQTMKTVYEHQHIDPTAQLERTAHGLFYSLAAWVQYKAAEAKYEYPPPRIDESLVLERLEVQDLKYPLKIGEDSEDLSLEIYDSFINDLEASPPLPANSAFGSFVGWWDGYRFQDFENPKPHHPDFPWGRITLCLNIQEADSHLSGSGAYEDGSFTIQPITGADVDGCLSLCLRGSEGKVGIDMKGKILDDGSFAGKWRLDGDTSDQGRFVLERRSAMAIHRTRPHPDTYKRNRGKALWSVARLAVLQHLWSWAYFRARRNARKRFVELHQKFALADTWTGHLVVAMPDVNESRELLNLHVMLSVRDQEFYRSLAKRAIQRRIRHYGLVCDGPCGKEINDIRYVCAICLGKRVDRTFDLCAKDFNAVVTRDDCNHNGSHPLIKTRTVIIYRDIVRLQNYAKGYFKHAVSLLQNAPAADEENRSEGHHANGELVNKCIGCQKIVAAPCYTCIDRRCSDVHTLFICEDCEDIKKVSEWKSSTHTVEHSLLRIPGPMEPEDFGEENFPDPVQERLADLERRYTEHSAAIQEGFNEMKDRMTRLENLLQKLALRD